MNRKCATSENSESLMLDLLKLYEKENQDTVKKFGEAFSVTSRKKSLEEFFEFLFDYFELDAFFKEKRDYNFDQELMFYDQKHESLNYLEELLRDIKPFLTLCVKMKRNIDIRKSIEKRTIKEDSIVNMVDNFLRINRTGRKSVFNTYNKKQFLKFKEKFNNIIEYCRKVESFDGKSMGSIIDFASAIREFNISEDSLIEYLSDFKIFEKNCSTATKYRFDKDLVFLEKAKGWIRNAIENYEFYGKELEWYLERTQEKIK